MSNADLAFYATAAQVIPLLLLALFAGRRFGPSESPIWGPGGAFLVGVAAVVVGALGEMLALHALSTGKDDRSNVEIALASLGLLLVVDLVELLAADYRSRRSSRVSQSVAIVTEGLVFMVAVGLLLILYINRLAG